ncbi:MAG: DNA cytosine methyltransferase [Paludibacteraceae bacterium]|nr:DNA cytosine methyltransferase [Paludibacteraceae bacterium]
MQVFSVFSFFSGAGFLDLGFEKAGFTIVSVNEFSPAFLNAYRYARSRMGIQEPKYGYSKDINEFLSTRSSELKHNILNERKNNSIIGFIGGPPCPDFSVAGKQRGKEGDNGKLSLSYTELIIEQKPDFFLFENVKGLWRTAKHRQYYEELKQRLSQHYFLTDRLCNAIEFGVPQDRDRILLFGCKKSLSKKKHLSIQQFNWDAYKKYDAASIKSLNWPKSDTFKKDSKTSCPNGIIDNLTAEYWFRKNKVYTHPNSSDYFTPRAGIVRIQSIEEGDVSKKSYKRIHRWRYSPTACYGNNEVHLHPYKERRLSAAEALAIQTLPKEYALPKEMTLSDKFKTIGNGVPYLLSLSIAKTILDFFNTQ